MILLVANQLKSLKKSTIKNRIQTKIRHCIPICPSYKFARGTVSTTYFAAIFDSSRFQNKVAPNFLQVNCNLQWEYLIHKLQR